MTIIVDYNGGNLKSVERACRAVGIEAALTTDPERVRSAERVIFPGVGHARAAMTTLESTGLADAVRDAFQRGIPILGICVGAQIILDRSEEQDTEALGLVAGTARRFRFGDPRLKIPHIGWNEVVAEIDHPLLPREEAEGCYYFVHSYYPDPVDSQHVAATSDYGGKFCCAVVRDNLFATQFHPEKSGPRGLELLRRFATWKP